MLQFNNVNVVLWKCSSRLGCFTSMLMMVKSWLLVGANGAGKTTVLKAMFGLKPPESGLIQFAGQRLDTMSANEISQLGIGYVPEGGRPFRDMNIRENLEMGAYHSGAWSRRHDTLARVYNLFPRLKERESNLAGTLSGGERQMLAIGRALMSRPTMCVFDEPSIGLSPLLVSEFFSTIKQLREEGITVLLIEQNVHKSLEIADRGYVLESGRIVLEGESQALLDNAQVKQAYLGI